MTAAVSQCTDCRQSKAVTGSEHVHPIVSTAFGERVVVDLKDFGCYVRNGGDDRAYRYLMVLIDHYSSWVQVYFLRDKESTTVWSKILDYMKQGVPEIIATDNGGEFQLCASSCVSTWLSLSLYRKTSLFQSYFFFL